MERWYTGLLQEKNIQTLKAAQTLCTPCYQAMLQVIQTIQNDRYELEMLIHPAHQPLEAVYQAQCLEELSDFIVSEVMQDRGPLRALCESYGIRFYAPEEERKFLVGFRREGMTADRVPTVAVIAEQIKHVFMMPDHQGNTLLHHILMEYDGGVHGMPADKQLYCEMLYRISDVSIRNRQGETAIERVLLRLHDRLDQAALNRVEGWQTELNQQGQSPDVLYANRLRRYRERYAQHASALARTTTEMRKLWLYASHEDHDNHANECLTKITRWQTEQMLGIDQGADDFQRIYDALPTTVVDRLKRTTLKECVGALMRTFAEPGGTGDVRMRPGEYVMSPERRQEYVEAFKRLDERKRVEAECKRMEEERKRMDEELRKREADLGTREANLGTREANLGTREADFDTRAAKVAAREAEVDRLFAAARAAQGFQYAATATAVEEPAPPAEDTSKRTCVVS